MDHEFTPAVERALAAAAAWSSDARERGIGPAEVLLGLLGEEECRAARMLGERGIDQERVLARFVTLKSGASAVNGAQPSAEVMQALETAEERLFEIAQPLVIATEHLLLGLAASEGEVGKWLRESGLDPDELEAEIYRLAGHTRGPVPIEPEAPASSLYAPHAQVPAQLTASDQTALLRILDAAANRAQEGLRVVEDYVRFALDDRFLTSQVKDARHRLTQSLAALSLEQRLAARDTQADVGTTISTPEEGQRGSSRDVVAASFKRLQQSLRSLEEYTKPLAANASAELEQLRYAAYTLERAVIRTASAAERLADVMLYVLVDGRASQEDLRGFVKMLFEAGADAIQLRDKRLTDRELLDRARVIKDAAMRYEKLFIMNDRPDLAVLARADGVHVGQEELSVKDVRAVAGPDMLIGVSTHSIEQARQAVLYGADYIGVGPTFRSSTKQFDNFPGVELVRQVAAELRIPAFAIGGIGPDNIDQVAATGAQRIAVGSAVCEASDPDGVLQVLRSRLAVGRCAGL